MIFTSYTLFVGENKDCACRTVLADEEWHFYSGPHPGVYELNSNVFSTLALPQASRCRSSCFSPTALSTSSISMSKIDMSIFPDPASCAFSDPTKRFPCPRGHCEVVLALLLTAGVGTGTHVARGERCGEKWERAAVGVDRGRQAARPARQCANAETAQKEAADVVAIAVPEMY